MNDWEVAEAQELKGYTIEWAAAGNYFLSKRNTIYHSDDLNPPFTAIGKISAPVWKEQASIFRPAQRLLRFMVTNVIPLPNDALFVTFDKTVGVVTKGAYRPLNGLKRPCRVLRSACAVDGDGNIYFGEYLANEERGEMSVYKYKPGRDSLDVAHTFPPNSIKHIHGLYFDHFTNSIFCLTGDKANECRILQTFDGCRSFEVVGEGDETWRAVSLLFDGNCIYYGTDAEHRENHIYSLDRESLERERLGEVSGTVFYSKMVGEDLFFASTAENAPSQKENVAALFHIGREGNCREIVSFKKDRWHPTYFQFGTIHFPAYSESDSELYFHLVGVEEDNRVFKIRKSEF